MRRGMGKRSCAGAQGENVERQLREAASAKGRECAKEVNRAYNYNYMHPVPRGRVGEVLCTII